jgi:ABC-type oligopeptide transport system substrate-binding subunit
MQRGRGALSLAMLLAGAALLATAAFATGSRHAARSGGTFRIASTGLDAIDPAISYGPAAPYLQAACALLLRRADKPGPAGLQTVPEAATGFPKVSRDGKTYTFTVRKGLRFSTGAKLTATSFAHELNRVLSPQMQSPGQQYFIDIVGAEAVTEGKATEASGIRVHGNSLVIRLTQAAADLSARLTYHGACAVPPGLPITPEGVGAPLPSAGPYYIADYVPGRRLLLKRNRFYRGSRPHHVDQFVVSISNRDPVNEVRTGRADWTDEASPTDLTPQERASRQYSSVSGVGMEFVLMNNSRGIFRSLKLRRAVNFALDRPALRKELGGPLAGQLTDHYMPSRLPGFRNVHVYPLGAPDVRKARRLVGGHVRKAVLYTTPQKISRAQIVQDDLKRVGIDVEIKQFPGELYFQLLFTAGEPWDLALIGYGPDWFDPSGYLGTIFDGRLLGTSETYDIERFSSPKYNRLLDHAAGLRGQARYRAYGNLELDLMRNAAPIASYMNESQATFVSKRTGCVITNPGLDLAAVCIK